MVIGLWTTQSLSWTELWSRCGSPSKVVLNKHVEFHGWQLRNKDRAFVTFALTVGPAVTDPFTFILTIWAWDTWATLKHISKDLGVVAKNGWKELVQCIFNLTHVKFGPATVMFARKCLPERHDLEGLLELKPPLGWVFPQYTWQGGSENDMQNSEQWPLSHLHDEKYTRTTKAP